MGGFRSLSGARNVWLPSRVTGATVINCGAVDLIPIRTVILGATIGRIENQDADSKDAAQCHRQIGSTADGINDCHLHDTFGPAVIV
jgi:hypothetical protein